MKIKTLNMIAFGKFNNKIIEFSDGFNLVFGRNEAGKTTIQYFIEGVLFGFYKPYRKKRTLSEDFYRFKPRFGNSYCGSLIYEDSGKEIRVERDFLKSKDGVRIFDNRTGQDISSEFPYDPVIKQYLPMGNKNINPILYNNTVNVKQLSSRSGTEIAKEVNDRLVNLASERSDNLSIVKVLSYVEDKKKSGGTTHQSKSNYGMAVREKHNLEGILAESEAVYSKIHMNQKRIQQCKKKNIQLVQQYDFHKQQLIDRSEEKHVLFSQKLDHLREENEKLEAELKDIEFNGDINVANLGKLRVLENSIDSISDRIGYLDEKLFLYSERKKTSEIKKTDYAKIRQEFSQEEIQRDYQSFQQLKTDRNKSIEKKEFRLKNGSFSFDKKKGMPLIFGFVLGLLILFMGILNYKDRFDLMLQMFISLAGALIVGLCIFTVIRFFRTEKKTIQENNLNGNIFQTEINNFCSKYGTENENALELFFQNTYGNDDEYEKCFLEIDILNEHINEIEREKEKLCRQQGVYRRQISEILTKADVSDVEAYQCICDQQEKSSTIRMQLETNRRLMDELSQNRSVIVSQQSDFYYENKELLQIKALIDQNNLEMAKIVGENNSLINGLGNPVEIKERIETLQNEITDYELNIKACELVENFFKNYSKQMHYSQIPELNQKIGDVIGMITNKYFEAKVDEKFNVKVTDPDNGVLLPIEQLSGGTVDQIYLALRFGIIDLLNLNVTIPIILDDPFVQYDEQRKTEVIRLLTQLAQTTQIILFTCKTDEKNILDSMGYSYAGIGI